ncbi:hypothetical protein, partial [Alicyclobacillus kakegawensis]|uniref:hypothetical protein n=1 Tax=Alicyclobacillus kakegawensis TaxID=392012 RepID=UPI000B00DFBA
TILRPRWFPSERASYRTSSKPEELSAALMSHMPLCWLSSRQLRSHLFAGVERSGAIAKETMREVRETMGIDCHLECSATE